MRLPDATYRIQFNSSFTFEDSRRTVSYLRDLGITDIYASPVFKARTGSSHGYDMTDPNLINPELGGGKAWRSLMRILAAKRMGWIQDIVPNHMAYDSANDMLMDVLKWGEKSAFFDFFDINWNHPYTNLKGQLLAPFLARYYGECLEDAEIQLGYAGGEITVNYHDLKFPLRMESYAAVLKEMNAEPSREHSPVPGSLESTLRTLRKLIKTRGLMSPESSQGENARIKALLEKSFSRESHTRIRIKGRIDIFNGNKQNPESYQLLDQLLSQQNFRLSFWKVAAEEVNYRRFFNLNELICLRTEKVKVFDHIHALLFQMMEEEAFSGLRIDHIDGLYDPASYLNRLRRKNPGMFVVVEKILTLDEELPEEWPVQGTTGYDALNSINGIFCKTDNQKKFDRLYFRFTGRAESLQKLVRDKKKMIMGKHMAGDIDNLAHSVKKVSGRYRSGRDITLYGLRRALVEIMAQFPVYRSYRDNCPLRERDRIVINRAVNEAGHTTPELHFELGFIRNLLLRRPDESLSEEDKASWIDFVMRFQQFTGPLMAKGFEDTVLYIYNRLLSLNEVGGSPDKFGIKIEDFHRFNKRRSEDWPHAMTATATHDTKRGEDVRARINVLSEIPDDWETTIKSWRRMNRRIKKMVRGMAAPGENDEYFLYQSLIGSFPFDSTEMDLYKERIKDYIIKAVREAKIHTAWLKQDSDYERAFLDFVDIILNPSQEHPFLKEFQEFQERIAFFGVFNSLSQVLLKLTMPGVPDLYQGTELWDLSLVDPDNRRPVDFAQRESYLRDIIDRAEGDILELIRELLSAPQDGRIKLFLIYRALQLRQSLADIFRHGKYIPLETGGVYRNHVVAFMRSFENARAVSVVPRFLTSLIRERELPLGEKIWRDTSILMPGKQMRTWTNAITGQAFDITETFLPVAKAFEHFPAALLIDKEEQ